MTNDKVRKAAQEKTGASNEQLDKGEMTGKVRGRDVDPTFHDYQFQDPETGEDLEVTQVVHDVPTGVGKDGKLETGKATDEYVKPAKDSKANQGEGGERKQDTGKAVK